VDGVAGWRRYLVDSPPACVLSNPGARDGQALTARPGGIAEAARRFLTHP